jgi:hypothetical protein
MRFFVLIVTAVLCSPLSAVAQVFEIPSIEMRLAATGEESPWTIVDSRFQYLSSSKLSYTFYARGTAREATTTFARDGGRLWMELRLNPKSCQPSSTKKVVGFTLYDRQFRVVKRPLDSLCHTEFAIESLTNREDAYYWLISYSDGSTGYVILDLDLVFDPRN